MYEAAIFFALYCILSTSYTHWFVRSMSTFKRLCIWDR